MTKSIKRCILVKDSQRGKTAESRETMSTLKSVVAGLTMILLVVVGTYGADVSFSTGLANRHVVGAGSVLHDDPVIQSDIFTSFENGFRIDLWSSKSVNTEINANFGDELDLELGWSGMVKGFAVDIGLYYFDEPDIGTFGKYDVWYSHAKVARDIDQEVLGPVTVFVQYENHITLPGTPYEGGSLFSVGSSANRTCGRMSMNVTESLIYDDGEFGSDQRFVAKFGMGLTWQVNDHLSVVAPQLTAWLPLTDTENHDPEAMVYVGVKLH